MIYVIVYFVVFFIVALVFAIGYIDLLSRKNKILKLNEYLNAQCINVLKNNNFDITNVISIDDYYTHDANVEAKQKVYIDNNNKQICFVNYQTGKFYKLHFEELINYEIYNNDTNFTVGTYGGGMFAGIFGAATEKRSKDLKLIIRINQIEHSQLTIPIIYNTYFNWGVSNDDKKFKLIINSLQKLCSTLEVIKNSNNK